jgi:hypothetical protein
VGGQRHAPAALPPEKRPGIGGWVGPMAGLDGSAKSRPQIRSPDRPASSESLYRLSYRGPRCVSGDVSCVRTFHIYCPIWVKFGTTHLHVIMLSICEFREYRHREGRSLLKHVNTIAFTCVPRDSATCCKPGTSSVRTVTCHGVSRLVICCSS